MKIKKGFLKRKVGDKYLVVTTGALGKEQSMFIEMNETSSDIWDLLDKGLTAPEIAKKLCKKYDITPEKAKDDVNKLIASMKQAGIFEEE